jgi:vancomycin resistance protein VanJ
MTRSFCYHLGTAAALPTAFALLLRLTLRDRVPALAALHYGATPFILALAVLGVAALWALGGRRRPALAALALAFACGAWQVGVSRFDRPQAPGATRLLLWNVLYGARGVDAIMERVREIDPDVVFFIEADDLAPKAPPGWTWRWIDHGMAVGVKGEIRSAEVVPLGPGSRAAVLELGVKGRPTRAILADLVSFPFSPRGPAFAALDALRRRVKPDLVLGDFNTPRDSVHFDAWRGELTHAFEAAGRGWDLTWPSRPSLLAIDHVWCAPTLTPTSAVHRRGASDHRAVIVELSAK